MAGFLLQHLLDHDADVIDFTSWLCCRVVSRTVKDKAMVAGQGGNQTKRYAGKIALHQMNVFIEEAAKFARQTICPKQWTAEDPQCCSMQCPFSGKTGIWIPRHVPLCRLEAQDVEKVQNLWWRNKQSSRRWYRCLTSLHTSSRRD